MRSLHISTPLILGLAILANCELELLGRVGNKTLYVDNADPIGLTWEEAREYCTDLGMELMAIESLEENELLKSHPSIQGAHWTAGRDVGTIEQFVWYIGQTPVQPLTNLIPKKNGCVSILKITQLEWWGWACALSEMWIAGPVQPLHPLCQKVE